MNNLHTSSFMYAGSSLYENNHLGQLLNPYPLDSIPVLLFPLIRIITEAAPSLIQ